MWVYVKEIQKEKEKEKALHSHWPSLLDSGSTWCWRTHAGPAAATAEGDARLDLRLCGRSFSKSAQDTGRCCSARPGRHVVVPASLSHQAPGGSAALERNRYYPLALVFLGEMERELLAGVETSV